MDTVTTPVTDLALVPAELIKAVESTALAVEGRATLRDSFVHHFVKFHELAEAASQIAVNAPKAAREMRLSLKAVRVASEKTRKGLKDDIVVRGRAIDSIHAILETQITPLEERLDKIEKAEEIAAAERKAALKKEREETLKPYGINTVFYPLGEMDDATFNQLHNDTKLAHEARQEQARKAEADRIAAEEKAAQERAEKEKADAAERERIRLENERLKKEAAEKEEADRQERLREQARREVERQKAEAERAEIQRKSDELQRQANEAAAAAKKVQDELEAKLAAERAESARLAAEQKAAQDKIESDRLAKEKADADRIEAEKVKAAADLAIQRENERKAAAAPDREKLQIWVGQLALLEAPLMTTQDGAILSQEITRRLTILTAWARNEIPKL